MKALTALLSALSVAALDGGALQAASSERSDENVLIVAVTEDPCCGSGVLALAVGVSGWTAEGARSYFIPFMVPGQAKPGVGERCTIRWRPWQSTQWGWTLAGGSQIWEGREVTHFSCRKPERKR